VNIPAVGDRFDHLGVEYVVNRITMIPATSTESKPPERLQIDAMAVAEVERRHRNLGLLLEGISAGNSGTRVNDS